MPDKKVFNYTVGELKKILQQFPEDMPVVVAGYQNGYENFYEPYVKKVEHLPENPYYEGQFQIDEKGTDVLILEREMRYD
jgi:chloramphenicol O-acetyltransferase